MSNNSLLQFASAASVEALDAQFAQFAKQDQERSEITSGVLKRLYHHEQEIHRLKMDLEDQTKSRMIYQQETRILEEQKKKIEQLIDKDPYVVVLIDGDGAKFLDSLLQDPVSGAAKAAQRLKQEVIDYLKDTPLVTVDFTILVRVFANLNDLARSLHRANVIESADDMRTFAEQFTNSRAEFDFINVGRGKENADSKIRKMFNHFLKNFQCKRIFFAGCHDNGYLHELREHVGDPSAKGRIVLVETTPAEPGFVRLGFSMIRFDTVFSSEPLGSERKYAYPNHPLSSHPVTSFPPNIKLWSVDGGSHVRSEPSPVRQPQESLVTMAPSNGTGSPSPTLSAASLTASSAQRSTPTASVTTSNNGGVSINYASSYATAGGARRHQNITIQAAKAQNPKIIEYNKDRCRLDPPNKNPGFNNPAQMTYKAKADKVKPNVFCNNHYLASNCKWGDRCGRDHSTILTPGELAIHRYRARTSICPTGPTCDDYNCFLSHHCPLDPHCNRGDCKFKSTRYGDLHLPKEDLAAATRWTEGISFPAAV